MNTRSFFPVFSKGQDTWNENILDDGKGEAEELDARETNGNAEEEEEPLEMTRNTDWRYSIFDSLSYPTLILCPDKIILSANRAFQEKFGRKYDIVGKTCHEYFYDSATPCHPEECPLPKVFAEKKGQSVIIDVRRNGVEMWEERVFSPVMGSDGEVAYVIESIRDITQVKALERELEGTRNLIEKMIQSSASGIVAADMKGDVLLMNEAAQELFGDPADRFTEKINVGNFYPSGVAREIMRRLRSEEDGGRGKLKNTAVEIINKEGKRIPGEIAAAIIYEGGREVATMGIYTDLREKIAVERKLEETQRRLAQSEKMASIGQLASGVAHEINNPLTGILFYADMAREALPDSDPMKADLTCIVEDVNRCKQIVKDLLTYSRQTPPAKEPLDLSALMLQSLSLIHDQKLFGNVRVEKKMPDEEIMVNVDRTQFNQVIINLVMNAGDAMGGSGTLTLRTHSHPPARKAYLEVSDTGCGNALPWTVVFTDVFNGRTAAKFPAPLLYTHTLKLPERIP